MFNVLAEERVYVVSVTANLVFLGQHVNVMRTIVLMKIMDSFAPEEEPVVAMVDVHVT